MTLKSKKKLFYALAELGRSLEWPTVEGKPRFHHLADAAQLGLKHRSIGNETYGKKSVIYVTAGEGNRKTLENKLEAWGYKVDREYWPKSTVVAVQVSYFKGWHWDE